MAIFQPVSPEFCALRHKGDEAAVRGGGIEPHGQKNAGRGGRALRQRKRKDLPLARAHLAKIHADGQHAPARGKFAARLHQQMPEAGVLHRPRDRFRPAKPRRIPRTTQAPLCRWKSRFSFRHSFQLNVPVARNLTGGSGVSPLAIETTIRLLSKRRDAASPSHRFTQSSSL